MPGLEQGYFPTIIGAGHAFGGRELSNAALIAETGIDSTPDWIEAHTGIRTRYWTEEGESAVDLATRATRMALEGAGVRVEELTGLCMATISHRPVSPSLASMMGEALEVPNNFMPFDGGAACAGAIVGLEIASDHLQVTRSNGVYIVGAGEKLSGILDLTDRETTSLFGDAAAELAVQNRLGAFRPIFAARTIPDSYTMCIAPEDAPMPDGRIHKAGTLLIRDRGAVKQAATQIMVESTIEVMQQAGLYDHRKGRINWDGVDFFVQHQSSLGLMSSAAEILDVPEEKHIFSITEHGNVSAAGVPTSLSIAINETGAIPPGEHVVVLTGVGLGYVGGAALCSMHVGAAA